MIGSDPDGEPSRDARDSTPRVASRTARGKGGTRGTRGTPTGALRIDDRQKIVYLGTHPLRLSRGEFDLLRLLASEPGRVFSSRELRGMLRPGRRLMTGAAVRQLVYQLRGRIEVDPRRPERIETVKGFGYRLVTPSDP